MDFPDTAAGDGTPFGVMAKPAGAACNLECEYCYYLKTADLYPGRPNFHMAEDTLETFVRQYIEAHPGPVITFAWQGGEPTLRGLEFFRNAVRFQDRYAPPDTRVANTFQTNGTRLDDEWCRFFAANDFLVGISIDGPREFHDSHRRTRTDGSTFDQVIDGLRCLQQHDVEHNVLCVLDAVNSRHPRRLYDFFVDLGITWLQFIPLVEPAVDTQSVGSTDDGAAAESDGFYESPYPWVRERVSWPPTDDDGYDAVLSAARAAPVTARSVDPARYGTFLCELFDRWVRNDVGRISVRLFDQCLEIALTDRASFCALMETCGDQLAIEHTGDVYACDHYVDPGFLRGNIHETHLAELLNCDDQRRFGQYKRTGLPDRCRRCPVRRFCNGGCPKNRHLAAPDGDFGVNYLCAGYRTFFAYVQPYLALFERADAEGRPPAWVSAAVRALDERVQAG